MKMSPSRWARGSETQAAAAGHLAVPVSGSPSRTPARQHAVGVTAKLAPSSTLPAGIPLPRRELNCLVPSGCSQQPRWDVLSFLMLLLSTSSPCPRLCQRLRKQPECNRGSSLSFSRGTEGKRLLLGSRLRLPVGSWRCMHLSKATMKTLRERRSTPKRKHWKGTRETASGFTVKIDIKLCIWQKEMILASA